MSRVIRSQLAAALAATVLFAASSATAQNEAQKKGQPDRAAARPGIGSPREASSTDTILAGWLVVDNQAEVNVSRMAQQRAQNNEVKQFAEQLVQAHQQFLTKLQQIAGSETGSAATRLNDPSPRDAAGSRRADPTRPPADAAPPAARTGDTQRDPIATRQPGQGLDIVALKRELGQQCQQTVQRELEQKQGAEFDQCFVNLQVMMHLAAIDTMEVFQRHASPQLKQVLSEGIQTSQRHLEQAKELAKKSEGTTAAAAAGARR
jgi:predicted outer membrane protein